MSHFRQLMLVVFASGAIAGFVLFVMQRFTVIPLIESAEAYETAARHPQYGPIDDEAGWKSADSWQRTTLTALTTMLSGIGFAGILFGFLALTGQLVNARLGVLWGLAAFVCFSVAPSLGLPPQPPGVAVAGLYERQVWWIGTAAATALGLSLILGHGRTWLLRVGGTLCLLLPHLIGAPAVAGQNAVPTQLVHQFTIASLATNGIFWLLLGTIGGFLYYIEIGGQIATMMRTRAMDRFTKRNRSSESGEAGDCSSAKLDVAHGRHLNLELLEPWFASASATTSRRPRRAPVEQIDPSFCRSLPPAE